MLRGIAQPVRRRRTSGRRVHGLRRSSSSRLPVRSIRSPSAVTSERMCWASISIASDAPKTSVDVVAANVPFPRSNGRNGPINASARRSAAPTEVGTVASPMWLRRAPERPTRTLHAAGWRSVARSGEAPRPATVCCRAPSAAGECACPGPDVKKLRIPPRASSVSNRPTAASASSASAPATPPAV